ncbi:MAG: PAS domain S-box protein [Methanoregula sp.]|nr:PAS domain S-box protein [Methanoregula sp.]
MSGGENETGSKGTILESDAASVLDVICQVLETGTFDSSHLPKDPVIRKRLEKTVIAIGAVQNFALCLSKGDLDSRLDVKGISAGCLKSLQSNLRHLTWQAQQIAAGDFSQRVDFMGEFSEAFNHMIRALDAARAEMKQRERELSSLNARLLTEVTVRRQMEDSLRESEEKFRGVAERSSDIIMLTDKRGQTTYIAPSVRGILGYNVDEVVGKMPGDLVHPDDLDSVYELIRKNAAGEAKTKEIEVRVRKKDGDYAILDISVSPVIEGGIFSGMQVIGRDITDRKKAEKEERLTRERFETLVKISEMRDASELELSECVLNAACRMTRSTLAFIGTITPDESVMDIITWSRSTMQDCKVAESPLHFPVQKAGIWADAIRTRKPKIVNHYTAPHPGKKGLPEGHVRITRFLSLPILDNGKVVMVAAVANKPEEYDDADVTRLTLLMQGVWGNLQRRRSEEALKKSEEQYRVLFEESPISLWEEDFSDIKVWIDAKIHENVRDFRTWLDSHPEDVTGCAIMVRVTHINRATMALFGAASHNEFSHGLSGIFTEDSYDVFREEIIALAEGKNEFEGEAQIQTLNGERKIVLIKMTVVPGYEQTFSKILISIIDISDLKRIDKALRQANKQLNLLSSITRHDILNQLMALKGYLELSQRVIDNPETLSGYIKKEQQAANTIEHQITFTRDYQELGVAAPEWQNVNASIKKAVAGLLMRDIHVDVDAKNPEIFADRLFEKVFYNLIDNALRYGGEEMKTIRFSSQESNASLTILCEDDGVGISPDEKKHLFVRGFGKNTGLGLFLSREILLITGITITENGTQGKGARFEITVPKGMWRMKGVNE